MHKAFETFFINGTSTRCLMCLIFAAVISGDIAQAAVKRLDTAMTAIQIERLSKDQHSYTYSSRLEAPMTVVVRDASTWQSLQSNLSARAGAVEPAFNFDHEVLLVVALGARPSGGYSVFIEGVTALPDHLQIDVREETPGTGCMTTQSITHPADVARMTKTAMPIQFAIRRVPVACD